MAYLRINRKIVHYDESLPYQSIGIVGGGMVGDVYDVYLLDPKSRFGYQGGLRRNFSQCALIAEVTVDLGKIVDFLGTGIFDGHNGTRELNEKDRPAFERTAQLYREILSALRGE